jgi:hypothetical protein
MHNFMFYLLVVNILAALLPRRRGQANWVQLIPLAIGGIQAAMQASQGKKQKKEAEKALQNRNPFVDASANIARTQAMSQRYPGQDQDEANMRQGVADTFGNISRASKSSGDILNAASRLSSAQQQNIQNMAKTRLNFQQGAMDRYRQALGQQADVQNQNRAYSENLKGAAQQNQYNAWNSLLGGVASTNWGRMGGGSRGGYTWGAGTPGVNGNTGGYNWGF